MVKYILTKVFFYLALVTHSSIHLNHDTPLKPHIYLYLYHVIEVLYVF